VSKSHEDRVDWKSSSDSLLRASRADHEASAADCARVEAELARRLVTGAPAKFALESDELARTAKPARAFTPGTLAKLGIGVSLLAAGSLAILRTLDVARPRDSAATHAVAPPPAAAPADPAQREPAPKETAPAPVAEPSQARPGHDGSDRVVPSRGELRNSAMLKQKSARYGAAVSSQANVAHEPSSPTPASLAARTEPGNAQPAPSSSSAFKQQEGVTAANPPAQTPAVAALETPLAAGARAHAQAHSGRVSADDSADARAELALVERIHAAMRTGKPAAALALCAEHAERWPRGVFTEEREAVRAIASCILRADDAVARARNFLSEHPHAPTAPRVASTCAPLTAANKSASSK
jgi:hypothetical protein